MKAFWVILALGSCLGLTLIVSGEEKEPTKLKGDMQSIVDGNNEFAFDLYNRLSQKKGNIVFSPYSISSALAMTYGGARGRTAEEIARVLHFDLGQKRLHPAFGELVAALQKGGKDRPYHLY